MAAADARFTDYQCDRSRALRDELFEDHIPLARSLANRYRHRGVESEDLFQVACLGLLKAIERFDPERANSFTAFAVPTITGELKRHFRDASWNVHVPRRLRDLDVSVRAASGLLEQNLQRQPTLAEIAEHLGVEIDEIIETMAARTSRRSASLERMVSDPSAAVDSALERFDELDEVSRAVETLDDRARRVLKLRFVGELSQREIAEQIGVSQVHVSRLLSRYLHELRHELGVAEPDATAS